MLTVSLDEKTLEKSLKETRKRIAPAENPALRKTLIEAGLEGIVNALRQHFKARENESQNTHGFPKFGTAFPKRYFWYGNRGLSVAEQIRVVHSSSTALTGQIGINSPALAHKLNPNPPAITPKGGRKYLAVPATPEAAGWSGMPRDFPGGLRLAFSRIPGTANHWLPSLVSARQQGVSSRPQYWLIKRAFTRHDPNALPTNETLQAAAIKSIKTALSQT